MNKLILLISLIFLYLGLLQFASPSEKQILDIKNYEQLLSHLKKDEVIDEKHPYSIILADVYREGVFIRTSYVKLYVISPFHEKRILSYKITSPYYHYLAPYTGYEILRHQTQPNPLAQNILLPPGFSFVANPVLGYWKNTEQGRQWFFYKFYKQLYKDLAWDTPQKKFRPKVETYRLLKKIPQKEGRFTNFKNINPPFLKTPKRENLLMRSPFFTHSYGHLAYLTPLSLRKREIRNFSGFKNFITSYYQQFFTSSFQEATGQTP